MKRLTPPPNPPPSAPSSHYPSDHPPHTQPAPFPTLTKAFDPPPASYTYPMHLTLPSANPTSYPPTPATSLGHKQLKARTVERPWTGMGAQQPDLTQENYILSPYSRPHYTSASRQSYPSTSHQSYPSTSHQPYPSTSHEPYLSTSQKPSTSTSHHSSPQTSRVNPLARWRAESAAQGPYHTLAEAHPPPRPSIPRTSPYQQGYAPSRASATRGSWDGYEG